MINPLKIDITESIKNNALKFSITSATLCIGIGSLIFICLAVIPSILFILIGVLFYFLCAIAQVTVMILSIYLYLRKVITIKQCGTVFSISIATICIGSKIMYAADDLCDKARIYIVNNTRYAANNITIGRFSDHKIATIESGKSKFIIAGIYRKCEIPLSYSLNGKIISDTLCGCHEMTIGENVKYQITESSTRKNCSER